MLARNPLRRSTSRLAVACLVTVLLAGCSADRSVFESTPFRPARVEVIDTIQSETVWAMDVPIRQKLVVDFERSGAGDVEGFTASGKSAETMKWWLYPADADKKFAKGHYWGSPVDKGVVDIESDAIMLRYSIIARDDGVPTAATPPPSAPPAPRPVETAQDTQAGDETQVDDETAAEEQPMTAEEQPAAEQVGPAEDDDPELAK